jgi:hypothetical protein
MEPLLREKVPPGSGWKDSSRICRLPFLKMEPPYSCMSPSRFYLGFKALVNTISTESKCLDIPNVLLNIPKLGTSLLCFKKITIYIYKTE